MSAGSMLWETPFLEETLRVGHEDKLSRGLPSVDDHSLLPLGARRRVRDDARANARIKNISMRFHRHRRRHRVARRHSTSNTPARTPSSASIAIGENRGIVRVDRAPRAVVWLGAERHGAGAVADRGGGGDLERIFRAGTVTADDNLCARA